MTKNPWEGGPQVTPEMFEEHLKEQEAKREAAEKKNQKVKNIPIHYCGPDDDIVEFLSSILDKGGANT